MNNNEKIVSQNKKAGFEYFIEEVIECGIVLTGTEIKSIRTGKVNIKESYCDIVKNEMFIVGMNISPYEKGNIFNHIPDRTRKLLLNKKEIASLIGSIQKKGYTLVPLRVVLRNGRAKIDIGLAKGKNLYDKRQDIKEKDAKREMQKNLKQKY